MSETNMETVNVEGLSPDLFDESLEEGEIVEDDEDCFETISDTSISLEEEEVGKFVSHRNNLRALSLSSISDSDSDGEERRPRRDRRPPRRRRATITNSSTADNKKKTKTLTKTKEQHKTINRSRRHQRQRPPPRSSRESLTSRPRRDKSGSRSDKSDHLSKRLQRQLREAVRIDSSQVELHHRSLRSRLKGMVHLNDSDDSSVTIVNESFDQDHKVEEELLQENKENLNSGTGSCNSEEVSENDDLEVLRLEALRTAIENKYKHRKKRKLKETGGKESGVKRSCVGDGIVRGVDGDGDDGSFKSVIKNRNGNFDDLYGDDDDTLLGDILDDLNGDTVDNNRETQPHAKQFDLVLVDEIKIDEKLPSPVEEDEDVLRALVLASMSMKLSGKVDSVQTNDAGTGPPKSRTGSDKVLLADTVNVDKKISQTGSRAGCNDRKIINKKIGQVSAIGRNQRVITTSKTQPPSLKITTKQPNFTRAPSAPTFQTHIAFPPVKPLIINVNNDSDSDDDFEEGDTKVGPADAAAKVLDIDPHIQSTVEDFLKQERAKVEAKMSRTKSPSSTPRRLVKQPSLREKSAVKLLPKSKQIEYKMLVEQIRKKKAQQELQMRRKVVGRGEDGGRVGGEPAKINGSSRIGGLPVKTQSVLRSAKAVGISEYKKVVREMLLQNNGRLQIYKKYETLKPLLTKVKKFEEEYRNCNVNFKRLVQELSVEKERLVLCRKNYTSSIEEFFSNKEAIDEKSKTANGATLPRAASTPIKSQQQCNKPPDVVMPDPVTATRSPEGVEEAESLKGSKIGTFKYLSPLERTNRCAKEIDPLSILCPYSFNGSCRDPDCKFNHL